MHFNVWLVNVFRRIGGIHWISMVLYHFAGFFVINGQWPNIFAIYYWFRIVWTDWKLSFHRFNFGWVTILFTQQSAEILFSFLHVIELSVNKIIMIFIVLKKYVIIKIDDWRSQNEGWMQGFWIIRGKKFLATINENEV